MIALQKAVTDIALEEDSTVEKILSTNELQVGFDGSFGNHSVSPRGLLSSLLNKLIVVEGIVTKCSSVKPKLVRSVHLCPETGEYMSREFRDANYFFICLVLNDYLSIETWFFFV